MNILRKITLIILSPFKLISHLCELSHNTDVPQNIITILSVGFAVLGVCNKMWPLNNGKWILAVILIMLLSSIIIMAILILFKIIVEIIEVLMMVPASLYDSVKKNIERDNYIKIMRKMQVTHSSGKVTTGRNIQSQDDAEVTLDYFIDLEKYREVPYLTYISD